MNKVIATIIKEWQLLKRDVYGLLLLLAMPAALIIVMALVQDAPFKDYQQLRFDLLLADQDHGSTARQIIDGLKHSRNFNVRDSLDGLPVSEQQLKEQLNSGHYKIGIVIPAGITAEIANSTNIVVNSIAEQTGSDVKLPARSPREQIYIHLYFDPVSKPAFRTAISTALEKYITLSSTNMLLQRLAVLNKRGTDSGSSTQNDLGKIMQGIGVKEEPLNGGKAYTMRMNSVQHNVPAWAIFGMFFIIIPIAGHVIKEREDGSAMRVSLIPHAAGHVMFGKIIFYTILCTLQFFIMIGIGLWVMPLFHLPALDTGQHAWLLLPVAVCISFAATAYGFFIGSLLRTSQQALPFGSVSIVILSAIGGIWVPIEILPHSMQTMALASPLHWSLDAVDQVILRNGGLAPVMQPLAILLTTGIVLWLASIVAAKRHNVR